MTARDRSAVQLLEAWDAAHDAERAALAAVLAALHPEPVPDRELCTITEAAARLGRSRASLHRWIAAGTVPTVTLGGRRYVRAAELDRLAGR